MSEMELFVLINSFLYIFLLVFYWGWPFMLSSISYGELLNLSMKLLPSYSDHLKLVKLLFHPQLQVLMADGVPSEMFQKGPQCNYLRKSYHVLSTRNTLMCYFRAKLKN